MPYTVYILFSEKYNKIYIGYTSNLIERFKSHNELSIKGYSYKYRPWKVIYCEYFLNKTEAILRERNLKSGQGRKWIKEKMKEAFSFNGFISA